MEIHRQVANAPNAADGAQVSVVLIARVAAGAREHGQPGRKTGVVFHGSGHAGGTPDDDIRLVHDGSYAREVKGGALLRSHLGLLVCGTTQA